VPEIKAKYVDSHSTGGGIELFVLYENSVIGSSAIAERGKSAENVAQDALNALIENHNSSAPVDEHMADQLIPYMALALLSRIKVSKITDHTRTNIWVCEKFLDVKFSIDEKEKIISI
jgi:RNA 3'-terminal phosphate cyclase